MTGNDRDTKNETEYFQGLARAAPNPEEASLEAQMVKSLPAMQETGFDPWVGKIPWRREWLPT